MPEHGSLDILRDLATVMVVSGAVILLFHWLRQPVILGYIIAGAIIGPYTPPFPLVSEIEVINVLAEIGITLLMFSLGLEFSLGKLRRVGKAALLGGAVQLIVVFTLGYQVGLLLGWGTFTSLFLGAGLSISSTALIVKVLEEQRRLSDQASQVVVGILVFEDFAAVLMIALLSGLGSGGSIQFAAIGPVLLKLLLFAVASLVLGLSIVRRLMNYVAAVGSRELSVVVGLGLCFGMALVSQWLGLSVAAGAFIAGTLVAEARRGEALSASMSPIKDMFAALFFVAIGMLFDFTYLADFWPHILLITLVLIVGKVLAGALATFLIGYHHHTALRVGMSLAQIGEFSLVIVKIGQDNGVIEPFLYPVIVGVTGLSTLTTPYIFRASTHAGEKLDSVLPPRLRRYLASAETMLQHIQSRAGERSGLGDRLRRYITNIMLNVFLFTVVVVLGRAAFENWDTLARLTRMPPAVVLLVLGLLVLMLAAFPLIAIIRHVLSLADIGAEAIALERDTSFILNRPLVKVLLRNAITAILFLVMVMLISLFLPRIPAVPYLSFLFIGMSFLVLLYIAWRSVEAFHRRVEDLLRERLLGERSGADLDGDDG